MIYGHCLHEARLQTTGISIPLLLSYASSHRSRTLNNYVNTKSSLNKINIFNILECSRINRNQITFYIFKKNNKQTKMLYMYVWERESEGISALYFGPSCQTDVPSAQVRYRPVTAVRDQQAVASKACHFSLNYHCYHNTKWLDLHFTIAIRVVKQHKHCFALLKSARA